MFSLRHLRKSAHLRPNHTPISRTALLTNASNSRLAIPHDWPIMPPSVPKAFPNPTKFNLRSASPAKSWTVRVSNPGEDEIFRNHPDRSWGPSSLLYNGYRVFYLVMKRPGRDIDHLPPSTAEVKERLDLHINFPSGPSLPVFGRTLPDLYLTSVSSTHTESVSSFSHRHLLPY